jgi:C4-dicarboxylate-specific signal transduction histidine kinase
VEFNALPFSSSIQKAPLEMALTLNLYIDVVCIILPVLFLGKMTHQNWESEDELIATIDKVKYQQMQLTQSAKMSSLGEMASGVAHEINNPLTIVIAGLKKLGQMANQVPEWPEKDECIKTLIRSERNAERIGKIIAGMRTFARDGSSDPFERVTVSMVVRDTLDLCAERLSVRGVALRIRVPEDEISFLGRSVQVSQVILNLINNANDAIEEMENPWIELSAVATRENIQFRVTDSGAGIPSEVVEKIMQPFFTTKASGKGTGLGLSISTEIAREHGGRLYYDANAKNASFVFELPLEGMRQIPKRNAA